MEFARRYIKREQVQIALDAGSFPAQIHASGKRLTRLKIQWLRQDLNLQPWAESQDQYRTHKVFGL